MQTKEQQRHVIRQLLGRYADENARRTCGHTSPSLIKIPQDQINGFAGCVHDCGISVSVIAAGQDDDYAYYNVEWVTTPSIQTLEKIYL
jgi:hypothetical protein